MIIRFGDGQADEFVEWLEQNRNGFVWNANKATLHQVSCPIMDRYADREKKAPASKYAIKYCASAKDELLAEFPAARSEKARCSTCNP